MRVLCITCLLFLLAGQIHAVVPVRDDSLMTEIENAETDSAKLTLYIIMANRQVNRGAYRESLESIERAIKTGDPDKNLGLRAELIANKASALYDLGESEAAFQAMSEAMSMSELSDDMESRAFVLMINGVLRNLHGDMDSAVTLYTQARELYESMEKKKMIAQVLNNESNAYTSKGYLRIALEKLIASREIFKELGDETSEAVVIMNIGERNNMLENYGEALRYFRTAIAINKKANNLKRLGECYNNIAGTFKLIEDFDSARHYIDMAIDIKRKTGDRYTIALSFYSKGDIEFQDGNHEAAEIYFDSLIAIASKSGMAPGLYYGYLGYAKILLDRETDLSKAEEYLRKCDTLAHYMDHGKRISEVYHYYYLLYKLKGDYERALEYYEDHQIYSDSLEDIQKKSRVEELTVQYKTEQKEKENARLKNEAFLRESESQKQQLVINFTIIFIVLLAGFAGILMRYNKVKSKINKRLKTANREKEEQNSELKQLNQVKNKLLSIVGHDLKGSIGSISSILELINSGDLTEKEQEEVMKELQKQTQTTSYLLENVMHWAKSQLEGFHVSPVEINPAKSVAEIIELFNRAVQEKRLSVENEVNPEHTIKADADLFNLVSRNLLSNAVKFTPEKGKIVFKSEKKEDAIEFSISDSGVGIPKDKINRLFKSSFSLLGTESEKGSGLGLLLCKEAVNASGGDIYAESEKGKGSVFYFTFPAAK